MLVVKVWCLPKTTEELLQELHKKIVAAVARVEGIGIKQESQMVCIFPSDMMSYGLGEEIIIEVTDMYEGLRFSEEKLKWTRYLLAESIGKVVRAAFPDASTIECRVFPRVPRQEYWCSSI